MLFMLPMGFCKEDLAFIVWRMFAISCERRFYQWLCYLCAFLQSSARSLYALHDTVLVTLSFFFERILALAMAH